MAQLAIPSWAMTKAAPLGNHSPDRGKPERSDLRHLLKKGDMLC